MYKKIIVVLNLLFVLVGCGLNKHTSTKKTIKSITINGSPNPPKGYKRPIVDTQYSIKK